MKAVLFFIAALLLSGCLVTQSSHDKQIEFIEGEIDELKKVDATTAEIVDATVKRLAAKTPEDSELLKIAGRLETHAAQLKATADKPTAAPPSTNPLTDPMTVSIVGGIMALFGMGGAGAAVRKINMLKRVARQVANMAPDRTREILDKKGIS